MNNSILFNQSSRFIIGTKAGFKEYFEMDEFMQDTSLVLKIDIMKQVVTKMPITPENKGIHELMSFYLNKYNKEGIYSKLDEYELLSKINQLSIEEKRSK